MPLFGPLFDDQLEEHIKQGKRDRLRHRTMLVVAQDRVDHMVATTGWRPPRGRNRQEDGQGAKRHG